LIDCTETFRIFPGNQDDIQKNTGCNPDITLIISTILIVESLIMAVLSAVIAIYIVTSKDLNHYFFIGQAITKTVLEQLHKILAANCFK
jgi:hypothetical protein